MGMVLGLPWGIRQELRTPNYLYLRSSKKQEKKEFCCDNVLGVYPWNLMFTYFYLVQKDRLLIIEFCVMLWEDRIH